MNYKHKQVDNRLFINLEPQEMVRFFETMHRYGLETVQRPVVSGARPATRQEVNGIQNIDKLLTQEFGVSGFTVEDFTGKYDTVVIGMESAGIKDYLDSHPGDPTTSVHLISPFTIESFDRHGRGCTSWKYVTVPYKEDITMDYMVIHVSPEARSEFYERDASNFLVNTHSHPPTSTQRLLTDLYCVVCDHPIKKISTHCESMETLVIDVMLPIYARFAELVKGEVDYINRYYAKAMRGQPIEMNAIRRRDDPWYVRVIIKPKHSYTVR